MKQALLIGLLLITAIIANAQPGGPRGPRPGGPVGPGAPGGFQGGYFPQPQRPYYPAPYPAYRPMPYPVYPAPFLAPPYPVFPPQVPIVNGGQLTCFSNPGMVQFCGTGWPITQATVVQQFTARQCVDGYTFGLSPDRMSVWVSDGCRATFVVD